MSTAMIVRITDKFYSIPDLFFYSSYARISAVMKIVVKVGTSSVSNRNANSINFLMIETLARTVSDLIDDGHEVILVTSGAVGYGVVKMGEAHTKYTDDNYTPDYDERPFLSSVGQPMLMKCYIDCFAHYGKQVAQVLISDVSDFTDKFATMTILKTLENKVIPVVNENDSVCDTEIRIGDNDTLSAHVAKFLSAGYLFLITDVDGFFTTQDGKLGTLVSHIGINEIDDYMQHAGKSGSGVSTGGMKTKLMAAKIAGSSGCITHIINNAEVPNIAKILNGENIGTRIG